MSLLERLSKSKVIVSAGTGGVGKTTVSAALGVLLARKGKKVLVLTIDPAKRLAQALGLNSQAFDATKVPGVEGQMMASMIDPKRIFDRFVERFSPRQEVTEKLKANRLYQQLVTALTGSQEFTSMDRLLTEVEEGNYDVIILDTPPTQNAVDFLKAPQHVVSLFDERITKWFIQGRSVNLLSKIVSRGTQTAIMALEKVTGSEFIRELSDFFEQMSFLQNSVRERSSRVEKLLLDQETQFLVVASADEQKLNEAKNFGKTLKSNGFHLGGLILNRAYPEWMDSKNEPSGSPFYQGARKYYEAQLRKIKKMDQSQIFIETFCLPETNKPLNGVEDIVELSKMLEVL